MKLTQKIIDDLFGIYKEEFGPIIYKAPRVDQVESYLNKGGHYEYRAGSKWSGESKFVIDRRRVSFEINADPKGYNKRKFSEEEVKKAEESFNNRVKQYLESLN